MKKVNISTLKRDLSRYVAYARKGGVVRIMDRDTPVAEIVPLERRGPLSDEAIEAMVDRLEKHGSAVRKGTGRIDRSLLRKRPVQSRRSVVDALIDERREGR